MGFRRIGNGEIFVINVLIFFLLKIYFEWVLLVGEFRDISQLLFLELDKFGQQGINVLFLGWFLVLKLCILN